MFALLTIILIIIDRESHTINNLFTCDLCINMVIHAIVHLMTYYFGLREDWYDYQPLCILRAYLIRVTTAAAIYCFMTQSISRLFFSVFYTHRSLLTWRVHWIMIILKWLISFLISIQPFFIQNAFDLVEDYRICTTTTKVLSVALYAIFLSFVIPLNIIVIIYGIILYQVRQSTRRVTANNTIGSAVVRNSSQFAARRNLKIMKKMLLLLNILMCGGTPYLILVIWNVIHSETSFTEFYYIAVHFLSLSGCIMMMIIFFTNSPIKKIISKYFRKNRTRS